MNVEAEEKLIIFGFGYRGKKLFDTLFSTGIVPYAFFDNNTLVQGNIYSECLVQQPKLVQDAKVVISVFGHEEEIKKQLLDIGYSFEQIVCLNDFFKRCISEDTIDELCVKSRENKSNLPSTIQLPITFKCNFDCVMCGMKYLRNRKDFSVDELSRVLDSPYFKQIKSVGVNGGEPFLRNDFVECIVTLSEKLPQLETLYIITNGFLTKKIYNDISKVRTIFDKRLKINISISVDGIGDVQDFHRGKEGAFSHVEETINCFQKNNDLIDSLDIICTITKYNIYSINEVVAWAERNHLSVNYNIATKNIRIENESKYNDFSVFSDEEARLLAMEFFYNLYYKTKNERYFALFLYLKTGKRFSDCPHMHNDWITITPDLKFAFCAARSKELASVLDEDIGTLVENHFSYLEEIIETECDGCGQYCYSLDIRGIRELVIDKGDIFE